MKLIRPFVYGALLMLFVSFAFAPFALAETGDVPPAQPETFYFYDPAGPTWQTKEALQQRLNPFDFETFTLIDGRPHPEGKEVLEGGMPVVVVVPHPDDEAFGFSGALATLVAQGVDVRVYLLSNGEGSNLCDKWIKEHDSKEYDLDGDGYVDKYDFGLARQNEFRASMWAIGVKRDSLVCMGGRPKTALYQGKRNATGFAAFIAQDCESVGFPLGENTRVISVAPYLGESETARFYGEDLVPGNKEHPLHRTCASSAAQLPGVPPENIFFFKVYAHNARLPVPIAPLETDLSDTAKQARVDSIEAYEKIGKPSAINIFTGSLNSSIEYASTLAQVRKAGLVFPTDKMSVFDVGAN